MLVLVEVLLVVMLVFVMVTSENRRWRACICSRGDIWLVSSYSIIHKKCDSVTKGLYRTCDGMDIICPKSYAAFSDALAKSELFASEG